MCVCNIVGETNKTAKQVCNHRKVIERKKNTQITIKSIPEKEEREVTQLQPGQLQLQKAESASRQSGRHKGSSNANREQHPLASSWTIHYHV